ncbi:hypothetical protein [Streptomyces sp. NPDC096339]|uniref:hypothetical protein n=1 Tax=Streptomyces sp. NPDC096339 TaxID=3366086 RepID=UPI003808E182
MRLLLVGLAAAVTALAPVTPPSAAAVVAAPCVDTTGRDSSETREDSSVDEGEIRWTDATGYDTARKHGLAAWQYKGSTIKLLADSATTVNDLEFADYSDAGQKKSAYWERNGGIAATDYIRFNRATLDRSSPAIQRQVAAHEIGHALGLCHKSDGGGSYVRSLMWKEPQDVFDSPTDTDKANYKALWK